MIKLDKFKVVVVEEQEGYGVIKIGPLPKGYGHTLGNTLRRILLSSVPGSAVTAVQISGISHEYSTMENVQDDIIAIMMRIKEMAVRKHTDETEILSLSVKNTGKNVVEVTAKDFEKNSNVEILNEDLFITTLTGKIDFEMQVYVESGIGYAFPDEDKRKELGLLPLDSLFSPVKRVDYDVENARFGEITNLDETVLTIYTDMTTTPTESLLTAVEIYDEMANRLVAQLGGDPILAEQEIEQEEVVEEIEEEKILVSQLNLSTRLTNALLNSGISDLRSLNELTREEVGNFKGMGKKSMTELEEIMQEQGIAFDVN